jgi:hypothetical protein
LFNALKVQSGYHFIIQDFIDLSTYFAYHSLFLTSFIFDKLDKFQLFSIFQYLEIINIFESSALFIKFFQEKDQSGFHFIIHFSKRYDADFHSNSNGFVSKNIFLFTDFFFILLIISIKTKASIMLFFLLFIKAVNISFFDKLEFNHIHKATIQAICGAENDVQSVDLNSLYHHQSIGVVKISSQ